MDENGAPDKFGHGFLGDQNIYLRNDGHGKFKDKTAIHFPDITDPSASAEFGDINDGGKLDLLIGNSTSIGGEEILYIQQGASSAQCCQ